MSTQETYIAEPKNQLLHPVSQEDEAELYFPDIAPATREDCDIYFDCIAAMVNAAHDSGLVHLALALEASLDACLVERNSAIPEGGLFQTIRKSLVP